MRAYFFSGDFPCATFLKINLSAHLPCMDHRDNCWHELFKVLENNTLGEDGRWIAVQQYLRIIFADHNRDWWPSILAKFGMHNNDSHRCTTNCSSLHHKSDNKYEDGRDNCTGFDLACWYFYRPVYSKETTKGVYDTNSMVVHFKAITTKVVRTNGDTRTVEIDIFFCCVLH